MVYGWITQQQFNIKELPQHIFLVIKHKVVWFIGNQSGECTRPIFILIFHNSRTLKLIQTYKPGLPLLYLPLYMK